MSCNCEKGKGACNCTPIRKKAMATAVDQYHKWDDMVFKGKDGIPPLVNVEMSAYTMDFFLRETGLLKLLFAANPEYCADVNTNMATVLYDRGKLVGIAIEYGDNERAYIAMDKLDKSRFEGLPDWQAEPDYHAAVMRYRIQQYTGRDIGLIKCADLNGFFGGLHKVIENENTLEMLLEGVKFACNAVTYGHLSIQPEPKFFSYLRMLNNITDTMDAKDLAGKIKGLLPDFAMGLVLQNKNKKYAAVELSSERGVFQFFDHGSHAASLDGMELKDAANEAKRAAEEDFAVGVSTGFLYNAMQAAMMKSPFKLGKAVYNAVKNGELVIC